MERTGVARRVAARDVARRLLALLFAAAWGAAIAPAQSAEDFLVFRGEVGRFGGQLVVNQRAEPKTLNPVMVLDNVSREAIRCTIADLIHINRETQMTEPALAKAWTVSPDGRRYTLTLRRGIRFSDGQPFDADDVVFSFQVYLDEKIRSPQRDLLVVGGRPIGVRKLDQFTVQFDLAEPYAAADRLFDNVAMLPRHLLQAPYAQERLAEVWGLGTSPAQMAGLGPFRFKQYVPGERLVLERNPYYWKADRDGHRLPYLDNLVFALVPSDETQALRFRTGEADVATRVSAETSVRSRDRRRPRRTNCSTSAPASTTAFCFSTSTTSMPKRFQTRRAGRPGSGRCRSVRPSRRRSIGRPSRGSCIEGAPRRCGDTCRRGTRCG
jgi:peptide/nickel transport system substrate-binding protein